MAHELESLLLVTSLVALVVTGCGGLERSIGASDAGLPDTALRDASSSEGAHRADAHLPPGLGPCGQPCDGIEEPSGYCLTVLTRDTMAYGGIAVDATDIYWSAYGGALKKIAKCGGPTVTLATSGVGDALAVDSERVYWMLPGCHGGRFPNCAPTGAIVSLPKSGGTPNTLVSSQNSVDALVIDATYAYWKNGDGAVLRVSLDGGTPSTLVAGSGPYNPLEPDGLAVDSERTYWTTGVSKTSLLSAPITGVADGGGPTLLASWEAAFALAVSASDVFVTTPTGIYKESKTGGEPSTVAKIPTQLEIPSVAVDSSKVYWVTWGACVGLIDGGTSCPGWISRAPLSGGATETVVAGYNGERYALAADDAGIYSVSGPEFPELLELTR